MEADRKPAYSCEVSSVKFIPWARYLEGDARILGIEVSQKSKNKF
jgi:hypothetical protein